MDSPSAGVEEDGTVELYLQGPMRITSTAVPEGWWLKSATIGGVDAAEEPYTFAANGQPVAMTLVFARLFHNRCRWQAGSRYVKARRADANGAYRVSALPPGDYWIVWIVAPDRFERGELQDLEVLERLARSAQRITLYERQRLVRDLPLVER